MATGNRFLYLQYLPQYEVLYCSATSCQYCLLPGKALGRHLTEQHDIKGLQKKELLAWIETLSLVEPNKLKLPVTGSSPIPELPIYYGFACTIGGFASCLELSSSQKVMEVHLNRAHIWKRKHGTNPWRKLKMQHFFYSKSSTAYNKYFEVDTTREGEGEEGGMRSDLQPIQPRSKIEAIKEQEAKQEEEMTRFLQEFDGIDEVIREEVHRTEETAWLQKTRWREHLGDLNWKDIVEARKLPEKETEPELSVICKAFDLLFQECTQSVKAIGGTLAAKYLVSFEPGKIRMKEFRLPEDTKKTLATYTRLWKQCICYTHRVSNATYLGQEMFILKDCQAKIMEELWEQARIVADLEEELEENEVVEANEAWDKLSLRCLQFSIALLMHKLPVNLYNSAIVSYAASLGLSERTGPWQTAHQYRPKLSGIIYCAQLLFLEHYTHRQQAGEEENFTQSIADCVKEWMTHLSSSPIGWLNELRAYAYIIAQSTQMEPNIWWDDDHQSITYRNVQVSMDEFQGLMKEQLQKATVILEQELCFTDANYPLPAIDLRAILDQQQKGIPKYSFLMEEENGLGNAKRWLDRRVRNSPKLLETFTDPRGGELRWKQSSFQRFEASVQKFLEHLLLLFHMTGGQPAREPEILSMRWRNGDTIRNIFVDHGLVVGIPRYHKTRSTTREDRPIPRFLPATVSKLVVYYLTIVIPFRYALLRRTNSGTTLSSFLWASPSNPNEPWKPEKMSHIMVQESKMYMGRAMDIQSYRHIAIAIGRYWCRGWQPINTDQKDDGHAIEDILDIAVDKIWDATASHSSRVANNAYAMNIAVAKGYNDSDYHRARIISREWHEWIKMDLQSLNQELDKGKGKGKEKGHGREHSLGLGQPPSKRLVLRSTVQGKSKVQVEWKPEQLVQVLQDLLGIQANWNGSCQKTAAVDICNKKPEVIVIMPTGSGKSLLYLIPCMLPGAQTTVLIIPLVALQQDTIRRGQKMQQRVIHLGLDIGSGLQPIVWHPQLDITMDIRLLLVSAEVASSSDFIGYCRRLNYQGRLDRIVMDEAHLLITAAGYRSKFRDMRLLRDIYTPFVFLTATLPPCFEADLNHEMGLVNPIYRRMHTGRPLKYVVKECSARLNLLNAVVEEINTHMEIHQENPDARFIVYSSSIDQCKLIAQKLGCKAYYAAMDTMEKAEILEAWIRGDQRLIVATSALGIGVDLSSVKLVLHADPPWSLIDYAQESGRAGRDGEPATSIILLSFGWQAMRDSISVKLLDRRGALEWQAMLHYLTTRDCRRLALESFLDDISAGSAAGGGLDGLDTATSWGDCEEWGKEVCDICERKRSIEELPIASPATYALLKTLGHPTAAAQHHLQKVIQSEMNDVDRFTTWLEELRGTCPICFVGKQEQVMHAGGLFGCNFEGGQVLNRFRYWKVHWKYDKKKIRDICFWCHLPQGQFCPDRQGNKDKKCLYPDWVQALCFMAQPSQTESLWKALQAPITTIYSGSFTKEDTEGIVWARWCATAMMVGEMKGSRGVWLAMQIMKELLGG